MAKATLTFGMDLSKFKDTKINIKKLLFFCRLKILCKNIDYLR